MTFALCEGRIFLSAQCIFRAKVCVSYKSQRGHMENNISLDFFSLSSFLVWLTNEWIVDSKRNRRKSTNNKN